MSSATRTLEQTLLDTVATGTSDDPFAALGPHDAVVDGRPALIIRTMQPGADRVELVMLPIGDGLTVALRH